MLGLYVLGSVGVGGCWGQGGDRRAVAGEVGVRGQWAGGNGGRGWGRDRAYEYATAGQLGPCAVFTNTGLLLSH